jgi:hypothetical protein
MSDKEIQKTKSLAEIESHKFKAMMEIMGPDTMRKMAVAGPE